MVDEFLVEVNKNAEENGHTFFHAVNGSWYTLTIDGMTAIGLDSLKRTHDCIEEEFFPGRKNYFLHVGFESLQFFFNRICQREQCTSASFIINSSFLQLVLTVKDGTREPCSAELNEAFIVDASNITLIVADPIFRYDIYEGFMKHLLPVYKDALNTYYCKSKLSAILHKIYCENDMRSYSQFFAYFFVSFFSKNC